MRGQCDDLRAILMTAILVLVSMTGFVMAARDIQRGLPVSAQHGDAPWVVSATPLAAAVDAGSIGSYNTAAPSPTLTSAPSDVQARSTSGEETMVPTPTSTPSPTLTHSPTHTPTATHTPTPTPIPKMTLRDDLPAMPLADWPRPAGDNGWGMHFLIDAYPSEAEVDLNIQRMLDMRMKWAVVIYGDEIQLQKLAPRFRDAGIMVVWRRMLRPYDRYYDWERDIRLLEQMGVPPYMQAYNEPSVSQEWPEGQSNQVLFLDNLMHACESIYNAGGYVGLQFVSENWLVNAINEIKKREGDAVFGRTFFVPHSYGMNHPPNYAEDINTVLSFLRFGEIFQEEIGFVPPMIVGEGGWKYGATDDGRYPKVTDELHRDYYVELYNWFRTGVLSSGKPLPDYLFAFCPWLISHKMDDNAFYDSFAGDRTMTIEAIKGIPPFTRRFSWQ